MSSSLASRSNSNPTPTAATQVASELGVAGAADKYSTVSAGCSGDGWCTSELACTRRELRNGRVGARSNVAGTFAATTGARAIATPAILRQDRVRASTKATGARTTATGARATAAPAFTDAAFVYT